jgi:hypothetical protein
VTTATRATGIYAQLDAPTGIAARLRMVIIVDGWYGVTVASSNGMSSTAN